MPEWTTGRPRACSPKPCPTSTPRTCSWTKRSPWTTPSWWPRRPGRAARAPRRPMRPMPWRRPSRAPRCRTKRLPKPSSRSVGVRRRPTRLLLEAEAVEPVGTTPLGESATPKRTRARKAEAVEADARPQEPSVPDAVLPDAVPADAPAKPRRSRAKKTDDPTSRTDEGRRAPARTRRARPTPRLRGSDGARTVPRGALPGGGAEARRPQPDAYARNQRGASGACPRARAARRGVRPPAVRKALDDARALMDADAPNDDGTDGDMPGNGLA